MSFRAGRRSRLGALIAVVLGVVIFVGVRRAAYSNA
jgi:hypothetical protein